MITAGIVIYNPEKKRLRENIEAILPQVDCLLVYLNSTIDIDEYIISDKIVILNDGTNNGIATALNSIMRYADKMGSEWCLLLDQDSVVSKDYISEILEYTDLDGAAIIVPEIVDLNEKIDLSDNNCHNQPISEVDMCITSGSYNSVSVWKAVGGFRDDFFIDYVDWEYCARVRDNGYKVLKIEKLRLSHELGKRTYHSFFGKQFYTFNHSAFRKYYITRNTIVSYLLYPDEPKLKHPYLRTIKRLLIVAGYEDGKMKKIQSIIKGVRDSKALYKQILNTDKG